MIRVHGDMRVALHAFIFAFTLIYFL